MDFANEASDMKESKDEVLMPCNCLPNTNHVNLYMTVFCVCLCVPARHGTDHTINVKYSVDRQLQLLRSPYMVELTSGSPAFEAVLTICRRTMGTNGTKRGNGVEWSLDSDGFPILYPIHLVPDDCHILGGGMDPRTGSGGHVMIATFEPAELEKCLLVIFHFKKRRSAVLIRSDGRFFDVMACIPNGWFDSRGNILTVLYDDKQGGVWVTDCIAYGGSHLGRRGYGYGDRLAWLSLPAGIRPDFQTDALMVCRHVVDTVDDCNGTSPTVSHLQHPSQSPSHALSERLESLSMRSTKSTVKPGEFTMLRSDDVSLDAYELRIKIIPYTLYPTLPNKKEMDVGFIVHTDHLTHGYMGRVLTGIGHLLLRGCSDYEICKPLLVGTPPCHMPESIAAVAISSYMTKRNAVSNGWKPYPAPMTLYFKVPTRRQPFSVVMTAKPGLLAESVQLYSGVDTPVITSSTSTTTTTASTGNNIYAMGNNSIARLAISPDGTLVECYWNPNTDEYELVRLASMHNRSADTIDIVLRAKIAQISRLDTEYISELTTLATLSSDLLTDSKLDRLVILCPGIVADAAPLMSLSQ